MRSIFFNEVPVPEVLKHDVASFRIIESLSDEGVSVNVLPNGTPGIVFQHSNGQAMIDSIVTESKTADSIPTLFVYGSGTEPSVMNYKAGSYTTIQIMLKAHGLNSLMGMNASALANDSVNLNELSIKHLNEQLLEEENSAQQARLLINFLLERLGQMKSRDQLVEAGLQLIHQNTASVSVRSLTESLNLSERQFERRFKQAVGISAKSYIRVKRFNEAVRIIKSGQFTNLTQIAHMLRFYDQSHFIRDMKMFSGITPLQLTQKTGDFHHTHKVYSYE